MSSIFHLAHQEHTTIGFCTSSMVAQGYRRFTGKEGHLHREEVKQQSLQTKTESFPLRVKPETEALLLHTTNPSRTHRPTVTYGGRLGLSAVNFPAEDYVWQSLPC